MAQRTECPGVRIKIGHRSDARDALPQIDTHSGPVLGLGGRQGQLPLLSASADGQVQFVFAGIQRGPDILGAGDGCAIDFYDLIADFQPGGFGGAAKYIIVGRHRHRIII